MGREAGPVENLMSCETDPLVHTRVDTPTVMTILKSLQDLQEYPLLVIFGPSGAGKSTLIGKLLADPDRGSSYRQSVAVTTRDRREGEEEGVHYHFIAKEEMLALKNSGMLLESSVVYGNHYGTLRADIAHIMATKKIVVMDLGLEALKNITKLGLVTKYVFITAEQEELKKRLKGRKSEDDHSFKLRVCANRSLIEFGENSNLFDKKIVNSDLDKAYLELVSFLEEEFKTEEKLI